MHLSIHIIQIINITLILNFVLSSFYLKNGSLLMRSSVDF